MLKLRVVAGTLLRILEHRVGLVELAHAALCLGAGVAIGMEALGQPPVDRGDDVGVRVDVHLEHLVVRPAAAHAWHRSIGGRA